jgi:hypothetical protein
MGPHLRSHADLYASQAALARADWAEVIRLALETDRVMRSSPATAFCSSAGTVLAYGALAQARAGHPEETRSLAQRIRATTSEEQGVLDLIAFALVLLGEPIDAGLLAGPTGAVTALAARSHDRALAIAGDLETQARGGARFWAALSEAIREEVAHDRGGPETKHAALRAIGYVGWSELLSSRV